MLRYQLALLAVLGTCLRAASPAPPNPHSHLGNEQSPYLLQHLDNPVNWYPWGEAAFERAREENKPIFLSIGYSTCHWCHVMERESFMDLKTAALLNEHFISIKLDREERPDIDQVYMSFVQAETGSGGWPLSVWLTPELKPFRGGTYFPPTRRYGMPAFPDILREVARTWSDRPDQIRQKAEQSTARLRATSRPRMRTQQGRGAEQLFRAAEAFSGRFDSDFGGFGVRPKFPRPSVLQLLHRVADRQDPDTPNASDALAMSLKTLESMARGGINDHLGGGFHRYSVDRFWHVPHFEKMLYDQAQLVIAYLEAYQRTHDPALAEVARSILRYVQRDMSAPGGGFYSAEDADSQRLDGSSEHGEGIFYTWSQKQIKALLGPDAPLFNFIHGVEAKGNARSDPHDEFTNLNILFQRHSLEEARKQFDKPEKELKERLQRARATLFAARATRPRPNLDDKILTAWNGLMISAYARAYPALGDSEYLHKATAAAAFLKNELVDAESGALLRSFRKGPSKIKAFAIDYALLIQGLLDLYEAGLDVQWLQWAAALQVQQDALFRDAEQAGYFASHADDPSVLVRIKESYDGAMPSENSVSALNLLRLSAMLYKPAYEEGATELLAHYAYLTERAPTAVPQLLVALDFSLQKPRQIIIAGQAGAPDTQALLKIAYEARSPHSVILLADGEAGQEFLASHAEFFQSIEPIDGKATAFICENFTCKAPTNRPDEVRAQLQE